MINFGIFLVFLIAASGIKSSFADEKCQLENLQKYVYQDLLPINASNFWIFSVQNDCTLQIWSNGSAIVQQQQQYSNISITSSNKNNDTSNDGILGILDGNSAKCKNGQISASSSKDTVSIQVFVQNNETSEILIKDFTPSELETTKVTTLYSNFIFNNSYNQSIQPLSCYSMPKSEHSLRGFIVCIFYNSNESRLFSGIYDSVDGNFSSLNPIHGLQNLSETLPQFFSSNVSVSFYRDEFHLKLTAYLYNENGEFLILENSALSSTFSFKVKKLTKLQKSLRNFVHLSSFEPFSIFFEAFTSKICESSTNSCRYLYPFLTEPSPICFDERKVQNENDSYFENVGIIFNNFQLKSDTLNPYANPNSIFKTHGAEIFTGILLITTIFLTILITFCVLGIAKCLKNVASEDGGRQIEISQSVHEEDIEEISQQIASQNPHIEEPARTIVVVESLPQQFEYGLENDGEEPNFKPKNFSFYDKEQ